VNPNIKSLCNLLHAVVLTHLLISMARTFEESILYVFNFNNNLYHHALKLVKYDDFLPKIDILVLSSIISNKLL